MAGSHLQDATAALAFVVDFAQTDLDTVTPAELLALHRGVDALLNRNQPERERSRGQLAHFSSLEFEYFQQRAGELLRPIAEGRRHTVAGDLLLSFWALPGEDGSLQIAVKGHPLDVMQYQIVRVLQETGTEKLLACPAPLAGDKSGAKCGRLFVKVTSKEHCSARCQMRSYMRTQREAARREASRSNQRRKGSHGKTTRTR